MIIYHLENLAILFACSAAILEPPLSRYWYETLLVMIYHVEIPSNLFSISAAILEQLIYPPSPPSPGTGTARDPSCDDLPCGDSPPFYFPVALPYWNSCLIPPPLSRYQHETLLGMIYHMEIPTILFSISAAILEQHFIF